jgi:GT2 family glycosyltransferase
MTSRTSDIVASDALPCIGIMILNQNGEQWLPPLYDSLRRQSYPRLRIYLVDNASTDSSVSLTQARYPEVKVLRLAQNAGYCMAYNCTMPIAFEDGCEWVVWANNDVLLEPGCLNEMGRIAARSSPVGVIGPAFICWDCSEPNYYMKGNHPGAIAAMQSGSDSPIEVDWVEGSFLMVKRECIEEVGWLDPFLFFYWEETDFCRRAIRGGWQVVLAPRALARHYAGGWSAGNQGNANTANYLKSRNQYIYALANPSRSFSHNLIECIHLFLVLARASFKVSLGAVGYELRAFFLLIPELRKIWRKWQRDRIGLSPEATTPEYANIRIEIAGHC